MFETFTAAMMLVVFLVPGFVWRTVEGQFVYLDKRLEWEKFALGLLSRSTFVYLPLAPWLYQAWMVSLHETAPLRTGAVAFAIILLLPSLIGFLSGIIRQKRLLQRAIIKAGLSTFEQHHIPTAWDRVFSGISPQWVIVTLKNGGRVHGYMSPQSYASSDPDERDLYVSHVVQMAPDGSFEFAKDTKGIYLRGEDITSIEFLESQAQHLEPNP